MLQMLAVWFKGELWSLISSLNTKFSLLICFFFFQENWIQTFAFLMVWYRKRKRKCRTDQTTWGIIMVCFTSFNPPVLLEQFLGSSCITFLTTSAKISSVWWTLHVGRGHRVHLPVCRPLSEPHCLFNSAFIWCAGKKQKPDVKERKFRVKADSN